MALLDRCKFTTTTTGIGNISGFAAVSSFRTPAQASAVDTSVVYTAVIEDGTAWERCFLVFSSSGTIGARTLSTSSTGALLSLSGNAVVSIVAWATDVAFQRGYLAGAQLSYSNTVAFGISAGVARDDANIITMQTGALTVNCSGTGANGLDTGSLQANTWYHVYLITKPDGTVAGLASTNVSAPTLPSGYTLKRRIGSLKTDGSSNILQFVQTGDLFIWTASVQDVAVTNLGTGVSTYALGSVPTGVKVEAMFRSLLFGPTASFCTIWSPDQGTQTPNTPGGNISMSQPSDARSAVGEFRILTDTSAQIKASASQNGCTFDVVTYGWADRRGRDV